MENNIEKTNNGVVTNKSNSPLDKLNSLSSGLSAALSKLELPRQFSQLVLFVLDGSNSMKWDGTSGFSKGYEIHQSVVKVLDRLKTSKNSSSFDVGFWAFANESKEMYSVRPVKEYDLVKDCFNPCEFIELGNSTKLSQTLNSVENIVSDYLESNKDQIRKALIIILSDGEIFDYQSVLKIKSSLVSDLVVFSSIFFESTDWKDKYDDDQIEELKNNLSNLASNEAFFLSTIDPEQIRKHMIQSVTKISNI